jgi:uncharacterized protein YbjT (DUF2867 family)
VYHLPLVTSMTHGMLLGIIKVKSISQKESCMSANEQHHESIASKIDRSISTGIHESQETLRVWIAGASGFCGRALTQHLAQSPNYHPLPHIRPSSSRLERLNGVWADMGVTPVLSEWSTLKQSIQEHRPHVIVSCIGTTKKQAKRSGGGYEEVDEGLNLQLLNAAESLAHPPLFIYLSSMGAQWGRWNAYLRARMNVENALKESSLSYAIIRPAILSGSDRDETRTLEGLGAGFSYRLALVYQALGLSYRANRVRPLDSPDIATFIEHILAYIQTKAHQNQEQRERLLFTVDQIHQTLQSDSLPHT